MTDDTSARPRLPTPGLSSSPTSPVIDYSPHTVPYNEDFENDLMRAILHGSPSTSPRRKTEEPPMISAADLPIAVTSHLRTHASPIPGLFLTHEHGYHTGGIGPSAHVVSEFAQQFIGEREIAPGDVRALERAVEVEVQGRLEEVRSRMKRREKAVRENERVRRELEDLRLQRQAELRVLERMKGKRCSADEPRDLEAMANEVIPNDHH
ncbi:hypothetical protein E8E11_006587 [Didymella keratinophila]|nr:hypothetical protein E8E11_006587 [Didymella keratinophila]